MFNTASDTDVKPGDVVERLRDRRRAARDEAARAAEEDRRRHEVSEAGRLAREAAKDKQLSTAHQKLADTTDELARQKALRTEDEQKQQSQQVQQRRLRWIERVALVVAFVVVALAWNEAWRWAIRVAIAGVVGFIYAREWVKSGTRPGIAAVAGVLAIGEALTLAG